MSDLPNLQLWNVNKLIPYEGNPKKHSTDQVKKLAGAIERDGFTQPIVIDEDGVILIGHGRRLAAMYLNLEQVPVFVKDGLSETQKHAIRISDNALPLLGEIDEEALTAELKKMMELEDDFEVSLDDLGLIDFDLSKLADSIAEPEESDEAPEPMTPETDRDYTKPDLAKEKNYTELYQLILTCKDESEQEELYQRFSQEGLGCRPLAI